ncbi:MAG: hypothetical protein M3256_10870 [Actinomycetota bacterium]|nr:hypothetical protein [Actinomycetota bacterium]
MTFPFASCSLPCAKSKHWALGAMGGVHVGFGPGSLGFALTAGPGSTPVWHTYRISGVVC